MQNLKVKKILPAIEKKRKELYQFENIPLTDPRIIKKSQELDKLLNQYYQSIEF